MASALGVLLRAARSRGVRGGFLALALGLALAAVLREREQVGAALARLDPGTVVLALAASVGNVLLAGMAWRAVLTDLGSRLPLPAAARVFLLGQVGKYVPGSVWQLVAQAELGSDHGVPRRRTASALAVQLLVSVTTALLLVLVALPVAPPGVASRFGWAIALAPLLLVLLLPPVLNRLLGAALRRLGRAPLEHPTSLAGTAAASGWALASWLAAGVQVLVLAVALGAPLDARTTALAVGGYSLAWALGFLLVVAPAGLGAREVVLVAALAPVLDRASVLVLVLASRVVSTAADLGLAGVGAALGRVSHREGFPTGSEAVEGSAPARPAPDGQGEAGRRPPEAARRGREHR